MPELATSAAATCGGCGTEIGPALLSCPACHRLVHGEELARLAATAQAAPDPVTALAAWRNALDLLPPSSAQAQAISAKVVALSNQVTHAPAAKGPSWTARAGVVGAALFLGWKLKFVLVFVATKGKLLLLGLTKAPTLLSMVLSLGVYWAAWGWAFAAGLLVSMYIHEIGHVAALQRFGIRASAPMFVPGLGAFVRSDQYPATPTEDARVGLAGPIWGLGAALAALAIHLATGSAYWAAIARVGGWLNLFNLLPLWSLDGGRGFRALSRRQRFATAALLAVLWAVTHEGLLLLLGLAAVLRAALGRAPEQGDAVAFAQYAGLAAILAALCTLPVTMP